MSEWLQTKVAELHELEKRLWADLNFTMGQRSMAEAILAGAGDDAGSPEESLPEDDD